MLNTLLVRAGLLIPHLDVLNLPVVGVVEEVDLLALDGHELPDARLARNPAMAGHALDELPDGFAAKLGDTSGLGRTLGHAQADGAAPAVRVLQDVADAEDGRGPPEVGTLYDGDAGDDVLAHDFLARTLLIFNPENNSWSAL